MPFAVLKSIREVSSEDKVHCANNLLQNEPSKKWKIGEVGEKSAYLIIEMETAYTIRGIDIGNEYSAFVEVLVGGPGCTRENFKEILITCSFMTPIESRNSTNSNRVRCFNRDALVKEVADEKWKLLKIVCTQPFNQHVKFGLSFIKIHVEESVNEKKKNDSNGTVTLNVFKPTCAFTLREDSPDSESESTAALFSRWKATKNKDPNSSTSIIPRIPSPAVIKKPNESLSIRKTLSTTSPSVEKAVSKENSQLPDRNRASLLFTDDDDETPKKKLKKLEEVITADQERVTKETNKQKNTKKGESVRSGSKIADKKPKRDEPESKKVSSKHSPSPSKSTTPSTSAHRRPSSSPCVSEKPKKQKLDQTVKYRPFNQLLRGVVLVISGIQNPDRADLRTKALALGAKYKPDWENGCTHLICAFKNTPKYNQVRGLGKIIIRSWIEDCYSQKKRLPWRRYALDGSELSKPESDEEIFDETLKPRDRQSSDVLNSSQNDDKPSSSKKTSEEEEENYKPCTSRKNSEEDDDDILELYDNNAVTHSQIISSGSDTEDDIKKVLASTSPKKKHSQTKDVFEVSTEEEDYISKRANGSRNALNFFKNSTFFISDQLSAIEKIKVERHIETFHGCLTKFIKKANYVIANKPLDAGEEFEGETVTPLWIFECNDSESFIPTKRYLVT